MERKLTTVNRLDEVTCNKCNETAEGGIQRYIERDDEGNTITKRRILCETHIDTFQEWHESRADATGWVEL